MKKDIHPEYMECEVRCSCGNTWTTRATVATMTLDLCDKCHPFYSGTQKLVDTGGRVQRFEDRFGSASKAALEAEEARKQERAAREAEEKAAREAKAKQRAEEKAKRAEEYAKRAAKEDVKKDAKEADAPAEDKVAEEKPAEASAEAETEAPAEASAQEVAEAPAEEKPQEEKAEESASN